MGTMHMMSHKGDEEVSWEKDDPEAVEKARQKFLAFLGERKGYAARMNPDGQSGKLITDFDPNAESIVLMPMIVGG